jgi:uncharacterized protein involved in type VI secretion and phage assembly
MSEPERYYGKYRGTVVLNTDPENRGRIQVEVPGVLSLVPSTWAEACVPLAGPTGFAMGTYVVPSIGTAVWVEFEHGDPNKPIWVGCRFPAEADVPPAALTGIPGDANIVIQSLAKHVLMVSDAPPSPQTGGIVMQSFTGATLVVNDSGIYLDNGKGASITMIGPTINCNNGTLTVLG